MPQIIAQISQIKETKSILIVSPSLKVGGIEKALSVLANAFVEENIEVFFITCLHGEDHYKINPKVKLIRNEIRYGNGIVGKTVFYIRIICWLYKQLKRINADVVLSFGDIINPLVLVANLGVRRKLFISDRTSPTFKINPIATFLKKLLYPRSYGFIAQTEVARNFNKTRFKNKLNIQVIPNMIDIKPPIDFDREDSVLYVGRLSWEKGPDRLIKAFSKVNNPSWRLKIAGSGPMQKELIEISKRLAVFDRIDFLGRVDDPTELYQKSSIFVLPSHIEGFPNALCEAMSAEMPSVCFESIPYKEIFVQNESGIAVEKDSITELTNALNRLIGSEKLRKTIGENARKSVLRFKKEAVIDEYLKFLELN